MVGGGESAEEGVESGVRDGGEERGGVWVGEDMRHGENWRAAEEGSECVGGGGGGGGGRGRRSAEMAEARWTHSLLVAAHKYSCVTGDVHSESL